MAKRKISENDTKCFYTENIRAVAQELYVEKIAFDEQYGDNPYEPVSLHVVCGGNYARITLNAVSKAWSLLQQFCVKAQENHINSQYHG